MRQSDLKRYIKVNKKAQEQLNGIEYEPESDEAEDYELDYPYDPGDIRIDQKMLSLFQICRWIEKDALLLRPEFQRNFVWNKKSSRF